MATQTGTNRIAYKALASRVLVVAIKGDVNDWSAYIDAVPGVNHRDEAQEVAKKGTKVDYWMARKFFPDWDAQYAWRE